MQETTASDEPVQVHHDPARPAYGYTPDPVTASAWDRSYDRFRRAVGTRESQARLLADAFVDGWLDAHPDLVESYRHNYAKTVAAEDYARAVWNVEHELSEKARAGQC